MRVKNRIHGLGANRTLLRLHWSSIIDVKENERGNRMENKKENEKENKEENVSVNKDRNITRDIIYNTKDITRMMSK